MDKKILAMKHMNSVRGMAVDSCGLVLLHMFCALWYMLLYIAELLEKNDE